MTTAIDARTGTFIATTVIIVNGASEADCDAAFTARYGQDALDMVTAAYEVAGGFAYTLEAELHLDCPHTDEQMIDRLRDILPTTGANWSIFEDGTEFVTTITN